MKNYKKIFASILGGMFVFSALNATEMNEKVLKIDEIINNNKQEIVRINSSSPATSMTSNNSSVRIMMVDASKNTPIEEKAENSSIGSGVIGVFSNLWDVLKDLGEEIVDDAIESWDDCLYVGCALKDLVCSLQFSTGIKGLTQGDPGFTDCMDAEYGKLQWLTTKSKEKFDEDDYLQTVVDDIA